MNQRHTKAHNRRNFKIFVKTYSGNIKSMLRDLHKFVYDEEIITSLFLACYSCNLTLVCFREPEKAAVQQIHHITFMSSRHSNFDKTRK